MRSTIFLTLIFLTTFSYVRAQEASALKKSVSLNSFDFAEKTKFEKDKISNDAEQSSNQTQQPYVRPDAKKRFNRYVKRLVGVGALAGNVVGAGFSTWRNSPEEWGKNWEGFGRRVASNFARNTIKQTTIYGLDEALRLDSNFYRSQKKDFKSRLGNALVSPFTARKPDGKRVFGLPRVAGTYASSIIAYEAWYPNRYNYKDGLKNGTISLGLNAAFNVFREFVWKK